MALLISIHLVEAIMYGSGTESVRLCDWLCTRRLEQHGLPGGHGSVHLESRRGELHFPTGVRRHSQ